MSQGAIERAISSGWTRGRVSEHARRPRRATDQVEIMTATLVVVADAAKERTRSCVIDNDS